MITNRCTKLARFYRSGLSRLPLLTTRSWTTGCTPTEPPACMLTDNERRSVAKRFDDVCTMIRAKPYFTTAYHPRLVAGPIGLIRPSYNASITVSRSIRATGVFVSHPSHVLIASTSTVQRRRLLLNILLQSLRPVW